MKTFLLAVVGAFALGIHTVAVAEESLLELRLVEESACAGCINDKTLDGATIFLAATPSITEKDFKAVTIDITDQSSGEVTLQLTASGSAKFKNVTSDNIGKRLAIIALGEVVGAPVIRESISGGILSVNLKSKSRAKELLMKLFG